VSAPFPPDIVNAVWSALENLGDGPLVIRSSSVLDNRPEADFSGKYKNVFVANQGGKSERINDVMRAIAQVYASTFGPEPIKYRTEHSLIDLGEEMGIIIQPVVGTQAGRYFLPSFSGTASSQCELTWLPQIKEKTGLLKLVPGLNLNLDKREAEDYPVLITTKYSGKHVYTDTEEKIRYSPKNINVLDLENNSLAIVPISKLASQTSDDVPLSDKILSTVVDDKLVKLDDHNLNTEGKKLVVTFDGLVSNTKFVSQIKTVVRTFAKSLGAPVKIDFASDGEKIYILDYHHQDMS